MKLGKNMLLRRSVSSAALLAVVGAATLLPCASAAAPSKDLGGSVAAPEQIIDPSTPAKEGMVLTASSEFNGTSVNDALFTDRYLPHWSTPPGTKANYEVSGGTLKLKITADQQPWDPNFDGSTRVSSLQTYQKDYLHEWTKYPGIAQHTQPFRGHLQKYGYFELRARAASGGGLHSAWWMTGANQDVPEGQGGWSRQNGEVDIFEILGRNNATVAQSAIHPWGDWGRLFPWTTKISTGTDLSEGFHTYGFEWKPSGMKVYIDGVEKFSTPLSPNYPMLTYLGLYEKREADSWTGPFDPAIPYPKTFEIDYFRAYQFAPSSLPYTLATTDGVMRGETRVASGTTRWLGGAGNDVTLTSVYAPEAGTYRLGIEYRSGEVRDLHVNVNDDAYVLGGLSTGSFSGAFSWANTSISLRQGWNTVRLGNPNAPAPDLRNIRIESRE